MASFTKLASGSWRVQVRHKGRYVSESFQRREDARRWATEMKGRIDRGGAGDIGAGARRRHLRPTDRPARDRHEGGRQGAWLGALKMTHIDRERVIQFGRKRAAEGAGPVTLSMDIGAIRLVLAHAAAVHGLPLSIEQVELGRIALKRLGLVGKSNRCDRRPTDDELERLIDHRRQPAPADPNGPDHQVRRRQRHAPGGDLPPRMDRASDCRFDQCALTRPRFQKALGARADDSLGENTREELAHLALDS
jgi:hypothetical protein